VEINFKQPLCHLAHSKHGKLRFWDIFVSGSQSLSLLFKSSGRSRNKKAAARLAWKLR